MVMPLPLLTKSVFGKRPFFPYKDQSNPTELLASFVEESKKEFCSSSNQKKKNSQPQPFMRLKHFKETPCITIFSFSHLFSFRCIPLIFYAGIELNETHLGEKSFSPHSQSPKTVKR